MKLTTTITAEADIVIEPRVRARIETKLREYGKLEQQIDKLNEELEVLKADLVDLREITGYKALDLPGFGKITLVDGGTTKSLDKKKLLAQGVTMAQLEMATVEKPKKGHTLITPATAAPKKAYNREDE
jgi:dynactin complex subunit